MSSEMCSPNLDITLAYNLGGWSGGKGVVVPYHSGRSTTTYREVPVSQDVFGNTVLSHVSGFCPDVGLWFGSCVLCPVDSDS